MNVTFAHSPIHSAEQVRAIITEARKIAQEVSDELAVQAIVFPDACRLLGARASVPLVEQPLAGGLNGLRDLRGKL